VKQVEKQLFAESLPSKTTGGPVPKKMWVKVRQKCTRVPVRLPLNCFHLRDQCFPDQAVPGRLPQVEHSGSCGTLPVTGRASPMTEYVQRLSGENSLPRVLHLVRGVARNTTR